MSCLVEARTSDEKDDYPWITNEFILNVLETDYKLYISDNIYFKGGKLIFIGNLNDVCILCNMNCSKLSIIRDLKEEIPVRIRVEWIISDSPEIHGIHIQNIFKDNTIWKLNFHDSKTYITTFTRWTKLENVNLLDTVRIEAYITFDQSLIE